MNLVTKLESLTCLYGHHIKRAALECLGLNRCSCPRCKSTFCISCQCQLFHDGYTCYQNQQKMDGNVCRFWGEPVENSENVLIHKIHCKSRECRENFRKCCKHVLPCGHPCSENYW